MEGSSRTPRTKPLLPKRDSLDLCQPLCWHKSKESKEEGGGGAGIGSWRHLGSAVVNVSLDWAIWDKTDWHKTRMSLAFEAISHGWLRAHSAEGKTCPIGTTISMLEGRVGLLPQLYYPIEHLNLYSYMLLLSYVSSLVAIWLLIFTKWSICFCWIPT